MFVCEAVSTPLKKRRLTADAISSSCSSTMDDGSTMDKHAAWMSVDSQFESRQRMLASRNLFEVRFYMFMYCVYIDMFDSLA